MRELRLAACETVVLSLADAAERRASVTELCGRLGLDYRIEDAIRASPGPIGCGLSHIRTLRAWTGERPLLVLEDDVAETEDLSPAIVVPDDADAVYLGISRYGAVEPVDFVGFVDLVAVEPAGEGLLRLHNVLGAHAIVHLTPRWRTAAIEAMVASIADRGWDPDRGLAAIQGDFKVYAPARPAFYQAARFQPEGWGWRQEAATRAVLEPMDLGAVRTIWLGEEARQVRLARVGERLTWVWD
jgi:hypothetical protein